MSEEIAQGSDEWFAARLGRVTASRVADVMSKTKTGWGAGRANYMAELIAERLTKTPAERFQNEAMRWGTEKEPEARAAYEFWHDAPVQLVGFVPHPTIEMSGASPDGHVGQDGSVEFKCPNTATHLDTLLRASVDGKYVVQTQWQMACSGRQWCDFGSFDPRLPPSMQLWVQRLQRDQTYINELEHGVREFLGELDEKLAKLKALYDQ